MEIYNAIKADKTRAELNENNDCGVISLAAVTGWSYENTHAKLKAAGRKDKKGTYAHQTQKVLDEAGIKTKRIVLAELLDSMAAEEWIVNSVTVRQMTMFPWLMDQDAKYLIYISKHVLAMVDGNIEDWSKDRKFKVKEIIQIL